MRKKKVSLRRRKERRKERKEKRKDKLQKKEEQLINSFKKVWYHLDPGRAEQIYGLKPQSVPTPQDTKATKHLVEQEEAICKIASCGISNPNPKADWSILAI